MKNFLRLLQTLFLLSYSFSIFSQNLLQVDIKGISGEPEKNIQSRLNVSQLENIKTPEEVELFYQNAPAEIKKALEPFGFFTPTIQSSLKKYKNAWIATFNIQPGNPVRIHALDIQLLGEGASYPAFRNAVEKSRLKKDMVFSAPDYEALSNTLFSIATDLGFFDAHMEVNDLIIDLRNNTAQIILHFNTEKRYRFGQTIFKKNPFDPSFLKRFADFSEREYYSIDKIQKFQEDLVTSNYFKEAWVNAEENQRTSDSIPVEVTLTPLPPQQYNFGVGYGTDTGIRGSADIEFRRLTSTGHRFNAEAQASQINSSFEMAYTIPGMHPATDRYFFGASIENENEALGKGNLQKISVGSSKKYYGWQQTIALSLQRERSALDGQQFKTQVMLLPESTWEYLFQNDPVRPSRGVRINASLQGTPDLLSNTPFLQVLGGIKTIQPLGKNRVVARASAGYTFINDVKNLPLSFQLFAGGAQSVRGYGYNAIGPGTTMTTGSLEYRQHIKGDWYAIAFLDAGSVSNTFLGDIKKGPGVGVTWQSPIGALSLTVAQAVDSINDSIAIQFSMGSDL